MNFICEIFNQIENRAIWCQNFNKIKIQVKMKKVTLSIILFIWAANVFAQDSTTNNKNQIFIGYDLGEMAFNKFQNFAGEVGLNFKNDNMLRFVYLNVKLTESHLSSGFAQAIDGENIKGHWQGYELLYDIPLYRLKNKESFFYGGLSAGYHNFKYQHTILNESMNHKTGTAGFDIGYRETNVFKVKGLYYNFQIPVRFYFNPIEETQLGSSTVNKSGFEQTISFFIGYEF